MPVAALSAMANNLKYFIKLAGMTNAEVAAAKGIAPESVSRHISGRSQMSIRDAIDYANILECQPEQLLFEQAPVPVVGHIVDGFEAKLFDASDQWEMQPPSSIPPGAALFCRKWNHQPIYDGAYSLVDIRPMKEKTVPQSILGRYGVVKFTSQDGEVMVVHGAVYPMPDNRFTIQHMYNSQLWQSVEVHWACPNLMLIHRPELIGWVRI